MTAEESSRHIDERLRADPDNPRLLTEAARYYHRLAMQGSELALDRASESIASLLAREPRNAEALAIRANIMIIRLKSTRSFLRKIFTLIRAARLLDRAVKLDPGNMTARTIRAFTALVFPSFFRRWKRAVGDFEYLVKRKAEDPSSLPDEMMPKVNFNLGLAYAKTHRVPDAVRVLTGVVARFPQSNESHRAQSLMERIGGNQGGGSGGSAGGASAGGGGSQGSGGGSAGGTTIVVLICAAMGLVCCIGSASAAPVDGSLSFRDTFLPPGPPSVAMRTDETAMLWNPAGLAMSEAYFVGYAWKGTYLEDDRQVATHFFGTKSRGFGFGFTYDDHTRKNRVASLFTLAPKVTNHVALGFTGKWRAGFNFDCGLMVRGAGNRVSVGFVARNLRETKTVRRYIEEGIAVTPIRHRLTVSFDVINEESDFRDALAYGGGIYGRLQYGIDAGVSYFSDGQGHNTIRASLSFMGGVNSLEGEYSSSSDHWTTLSGRLAYQSGR